ncbi:MAG: spheroidene monooxygenase [Cyclobacteriaceae bacterium]
MSQLTTVTFFKFNTIADKFWALSMMQLAHADLKKVSGQSFYKLMGSGRGLGFNALPDWSTYALLQVWEGEDSAHSFLQASKIMHHYRKHAVEVWTIFLKNISAHGQWDGRNPFEVEENLPSTELMVVLTRATIEWHKVIPFWKYVPTSHQPLKDNDGLIYTKGIGEVPIIQMATFSIWKSKESLNHFAYASNEHRVAIQKTRELNWYKEELFARFKPYKSIGTWNEKNPLAEFLGS